MSACTRRAGHAAAAAAAALAAAVLMSGCANAPPPVYPAPVILPDANGPDESAPPAPPGQSRASELAAFKAVLSGREAVPPADGPARGELVAVLNRGTGLFRWKLTFSGLSGPVRGAYFHGPAVGGQVAQPVLPVGGRGIRSPYEGRAQLTLAQLNALLAGYWYVNLRTERFPEGELRGQLIEQQ